MKEIKNVTIRFKDGTELKDVSRQEKISEKEIKNATIRFEDGTEAKIIHRQEKIFDIILSTGKKAGIILKSSKGIRGRFYEGSSISRNEEEELKEVEEFLK